MRYLLYIAWFIFGLQEGTAQPIKTVVGGHNQWPSYILEDGSGLVKDAVTAALRRKISTLKCRLLLLVE